VHEIDETPELTRARYFTPAEANELLQQLLPKMAEAKALLEEAQGKVAGMEREAATALRERAVVEVKDLQEKMRALLEEMRDEGVEVKGIAPGLLDFPALRYGVEVFLCWKEGEDVIEWWHPIPTGIAGRQRLADTEPGAWEWCN
jgi:hypothetical protein